MGGHFGYMPTSRERREPTFEEAGWTRIEPPVEGEAAVDKDGSGGGDRSGSQDPAPAPQRDASKDRHRTKRKRRKITTTKEPDADATSPGEDRGDSGGNPGPALVPQPHGGALWTRGHPNPRPGPGRPPSALRVDLHDLAAGDGMRALRAILADDHARNSDRLNALAIALRYGLGSSDELSIGVAPDPRLAMDALRRALAEEVRRVGPAAFTAELERLLDEEPRVEGDA